MPNNPFSSVPTVLPDWSNAEEVFCHIDYRLFQQNANVQTLDSLATRVQYDSLENHKWYAVKIQGRFGPVWWLIYMHQKIPYTIILGSFGRESGFVPCSVVGTHVTIVPVGNVLPPLPESFLADADQRGTPVGMYPVGETVYGERLRAILQDRSFESEAWGTLSIARALEYSHRRAYEYFQHLDRNVDPLTIFSRVFPTVKEVEVRTPLRRTKGYDPKAVGYVSREDTKCDRRKPLTEAQRVKRSLKRRLTKAQRRHR